MELKKLAALAAAAVMPLSLISCTFGYQSDRDKKEASNNASLRQEARTADTSGILDRYENIDIDKLNSDIEKFLDDVHSSGNDVQADIDGLLDTLAKSYNAKTFSEIAYYMDFGSDALEAEADGCTEEASVAYEAISYAFHVAYQSAYPEYVDLIRPYIDDDWLDYYNSPGVTLERIEKNTRQAFASGDSDLDEYYDVAYGSETDEDKLDLEAAKIYLQILEGYDTETFYDDFSRDYTPEEIMPVCEMVRSELVPVSQHGLDAVMDHPSYEDLIGADFPGDELLPTLQKYAERLSPQIGEAAKRLSDKDLCFITEGRNSYNGSFTATLPADGDSVIYIYRDELVTDMIGIIHEFGHFYASYYDDTSAYDQTNCLDVAEIQSQGMELLFLQFYDEIFGDNGSIMRLYKLNDILDYAISGCLMAEFEYKVLENRDSLTPEEVVECYHEIMDDYYPDSHFYYVSHIFEQPGYYISYGVSALAALDIISDCYDDRDRALEKYEKIAHVKAFSPDCSFKAALSDCGLSDVLTEDYIKGLAATVDGLISREEG
ncbi:MAG: hypothetical protein IJ071_11870 [Ruminococcus sp.]|nr:hypothetical protein [Ruminococcus sp.]